MSAETSVGDNADIIVAGAGIVGATLALILAQRHPDLRITVLEASAAPVTYSQESFDPRVVALNQQSVDLMRSLGVWEAMVQLRVCAYRAMRVWDGEGTGAIEFDAADLHEDVLGFIVENAVVLSVLRDALSQCRKVNWLAPAAVTGVTRLNTDVEVALEGGQSVRASLVVGADGAQSSIRTQAQWATNQWSYGQSAIITTVKTELGHNNTAMQRFTDFGPLAFLPLDLHNGGNQNYCSIVWSLNESQVAPIAALDTPSFCQELSRSFEHCLGQVEWADKRCVIPLKQMHVKTYYKPGVVLVGDAAHTIHPLAGQGVNLGLRDVVMLSQECGRALQRRVPLGHNSLLKRYQRNVQTHNLLAMAAMEGFKQLFVHSNPWVRVARNFGLKQVNRQSELKRQLMSAASGFGTGG